MSFRRSLLTREEKRREGCVEKHAGALGASFKKDAVSDAARDERRRTNTTGRRRLTAADE